MLSRRPMRVATASRRARAAKPRMRQRFGHPPLAGCGTVDRPELDQGFGLDDTVGLAGFPSGEA